MIKDYIYNFHLPKTALRINPISHLTIKTITMLNPRTRANCFLILEMNLKKIRRGI